MMASHARAAAVALGLFALFGFLACSSSDSGSTSGPNATTDPEPLFRDLQDDLVASCGGPNGTCHVAGTYQSAPKWLAGPDPYVSAKNYRGILPATKEVGDSILLTQVAHECTALKDVKSTNGKAPLFERVATWLQAEVPPPPLPNTGAFSVPTGFNQVNLDAAGVPGGRITFLATDVNGVLSLTAMRIYAPPTLNVKISAPFFVILPRSGKVNADPTVNGFQGELTVAAGTNVDFYSGKMILLRWDSTGQLKIAFQTLETTPGQGTNTSCTALDVFTSKAIPAMQMQVQVIDPGEGDGGAGAGDGGTVIGQGSCLGCHADTANPPAYPPAVNAMDLRGFDTDPASACVQARRWINFTGARDQSTLLLNPTGQANPAHPMQPLSASDPIVTGIAAWVNAEQP
jgi:hypothetical protein